MFLKLFVKEEYMAVSFVDPNGTEISGLVPHFVKPNGIWSKPKRVSSEWLFSRKLLAVDGDTCVKPCLFRNDSRHLGDASISK